MSVFTNAGSGDPEESKAYTAAILGLLGSRDPMMVLRETPSALRDACDGLTGDQLLQAEAPGKWSVRHVIQHLADAEIVFAYRMRMILAHDRPDIYGYNQDLWAERTDYSGITFDEAMEDFTALRRLNLRLLARTDAAGLDRIGVHSERGEESLGLLIRLYAGHDLLHLKQIGRIRKAVA